MQDFHIEIKYLKRTRRATLRVLPGKIIRVTAPYQFREEQVKKFILKNSNWILKRHHIIESAPAIVALTYSEGESFSFKGRIFFLQFIIGREAPSLFENQFIVPVPQHKQGQTKWIRKKIISWYKEQALSELKARVKFYADQLGVKEKSISLKNYKSRWGCCSTQGDLIFNWQIITFAEELINYVVAHEVCHLKEMNHSVRFYSHLQALGFEKRKYHALMRTARHLFVGAT